MVTKRARVEHTAPNYPTEKLLDAIPCLTSLPLDMTVETEHSITQKYFNRAIQPNRFKYVSIIKLYGQKPNTAVFMLRDSGAFSSSLNRQTLVDLVSDARCDRVYSIECANDTLDKVECYAKYAFSLEADGLTVGCGNVAMA